MPEPTTPMPQPLYREVEEAEGVFNHLRNRYLRRWGWKQTCNTPGSFWLWQRDFAAEDAATLARHNEAKTKAEAEGRVYTPSEPRPYGVITADTDLAISMTVKCLDEQPEEEGNNGE